MRSHSLYIHVQLSKQARGLYFAMNLHLCPIFVCMRSEGHGEPAQIGETAFVHILKKSTVLELPCFKQKIIQVHLNRTCVVLEYRLHLNKCLM